VDAEDRVLSVYLAAQQSLNLELAELGFEDGHVAGELVQRGLIVRFDEADELGEVAQPLLESVDGVAAGCERFQSLDGLAGLGLIRPEITLRHRLLDLGDAAGQGLQVKDTSAVGSSGPEAPPDDGEGR
jgi:hypothetical protein